MKTVTSATQAKVLARFFRVLGDPTRLALIRELEGGERTCLRHCGFAIAERRGKEVVYRLAVRLQDLLVFYDAEGLVRSLAELGWTARVEPLEETLILGWAQPESRTSG